METLQSSMISSLEGIPTASPSFLTSCTRLDQKSKLQWFHSYFFSLLQNLASLKSNPSSGTLAQTQIGGKQWREQSAKQKMTLQNQNQSPSHHRRRTTPRNGRRWQRRQDWTTSAFSLLPKTCHQHHISLSSHRWAPRHLILPQPRSQPPVATT